MKKISRKCLCALMAAFMAASWGVAPGGGAAAFAADEDTALSVLSAIGVVSPDSAGSYNLTRQLTRAEFAKMIITASSYKDSVTASSSSLFKDVAAGNWAAGYVKLAVTAGLLSGYSDGTFRPNEPVKTEQAVNAALKLLGYVTSDFRGAFPDAQMNIFKGSALSQGMSAAVGAPLSRGEAVKLIYNMLNTKLKDGSKKYAESLNYKLNAAGEIDYAALLTSNMNGPYTVKNGSWASDNGLSGLTYAVYKNGKPATPSDIKTYDVLYYNNGKSIVWVYDKKVTGVFERANPSQNDVTSVVVSGTEYKLESSNAFTALSSSGSLRVGNTITLLMGKDGGVADAVASASITEATTLYVTEVGTKAYTNANDQTYNAAYIKGVTVAGDVAEFPVSQTWIKKGEVVKVDYAGGAANVSRVGGGALNGKVDAALYKLGTSQMAADVRIMDTFNGAYAAISPQRLDGVTINSDKVLYYAASGGQVTAIILDNVTADLAAYGILTVSNVNNSSGSASISGSYSWIRDGLTKTFSTQGSAFSTPLGPVKAELSGETPETLRSLRNLSGKAKSLDASWLTTTGTIEKWPVSPKVGVYSNPLSGQYAQVTLTDAISAMSGGKTVDFFYDDEPGSGGQIRIIIIRG
ncbi:MAG: S-layer homology domain-containing protein [Clostridiales Family XIII bacterium]|nr:S-layer homology domain-containing protein [Clostridiales Family XIII bacterium]